MAPWRIFGVMRRRWQRLRPFLGVTGWVVVGLAAAAIVGGFLEALLLGIVGNVAAAVSEGATTAELDIGPVTLSGKVGTLLPIAAGMAIIRLLLRLFAAWWPAKISTDAEFDLRRRLYTSYMLTAYERQAAEPVGRVVTAISAHTAQVARASIDLAEMFGALATFATMVAAAFLLSVPVALLVLVASGLLFVALYPASRLARRYTHRISLLEVDLNQMLAESVRLVEEARIYDAQHAFNEQAVGIMEDLRLPSRRSSFLRRATPALYAGVLLLLDVVGIMVVVALNPDDIGSLAAVVLVLIRASSYGQQVQGRAHRLAEVKPFLLRLEEALVDWQPEPEFEGGHAELGPIESLSFRDVTYAYDDDAEVLHGIDLEVGAGEAIGIVGPSGAGKSTFIKVLLGLRPATSGSYLVNGTDVRDVDPHEWWKRIAYVSQDPRVLEGSVRANIRFLRDHLSEEDIVRAAKLAHIHDEILSWDDGYDRVVGPRAGAVSGGQQQRIALARALAERPEVLVLDEPTSDLDLRSEQLIQESLEALRGETTLFIVAHRLTTLSVCDRVLVFRDGRLEASGSSTDLAATNEFFREASGLTAQAVVQPPS